MPGGSVVIVQDERGIIRAADGYLLVGEAQAGAGQRARRDQQLLRG
jgi:hypothetical protein